MTFLPQQIVPPDAKQQALTEQHLGALGDGLMGYFLQVRADLDPHLAQKMPIAAGKAYPYGRCEEITSTVFAHLRQRLARPEHPVEHALRAFIAQGGVGHSIWGVLRGQYFQNALQFGSLYVDVSNDTVVVTKPKVEILPVMESGLVPVRDLAHFRQTALSYWGASCYANTLCPSLAPILPLITFSPGKLLPSIQSACDYMIGLMSRDGFQQAEEWLRDGPAPPPDIAEAVLAALPPDLLAQTADGRAEGVAACQAARQRKCQTDAGWRQARVRDYLRTRPTAVSPIGTTAPAHVKPADIRTGRIW